jgi:hypothetical protein
LQGRFRLGATLGAVLTALSLPAASGALAEEHRSVQQIEVAPRVEAKHPRLDSTLARLTQATRARGRIVEVEAIARGARRGELEAAIRAAGGLASGRYGRLLEARLPVSALETVAAHPAARFLRTPIRPQPQAVTGQGIAASGAEPWHNAGWTGTGVKIAIVDVGFRGWRALQPPQGDLPASVATADFCPAGQFDGLAADEHGAAIAEVVHELAPAAELHLICIDSVTSLGQAKDYVIAHDIPIVNHSVGWLNAGRGDGSGGPDTPEGIVANARAQGVLWVNSAGNYGQTHWSGTFSDPDGNGLHNFANFPRDEGNGVFLLGGGCVFLKWDDWPFSDQDFDLHLFQIPNKNGSPAELIDVSENVQNGSQEPVEEVCTNFLGGDHYVAIERQAATAFPRFDLFVTKGDFLEYKVSAGSLVEPAGSPSTLAVGAICWVPGSFQVRDYSSRGPAIGGLPKPDLLGYDGVSSQTYGPSSDCADPDFLGTSPGAAHVSGAAALLLQANPGFGPAELQAELESRASDLGPFGKDNDFGAGKLKLGAAPPPPPSATPQSVTTDEDTPELITLAGTDPGGDPLTFKITSLPAHGTLYRGNSAAIGDRITAVPTSLSGNQVTYMPAAHYNGPDGFAFKVADASGESAPATVSITVTAVNDAPVCLDRVLSTAEDTPAQVAPSCSDVDSAALAYTIVTQGTKGSAAVADGQLFYTPDGDANGSDSFGYRASDGSADSGAATVAVTIAAVNDAPVCLDRPLSTAEDTTAHVAPSCSDVDSPALTYAVAAQGTKGSAAVAGGLLRYTPVANANGADSFRYRASDGTAPSSAATVTVTIHPVNDAPACLDLALSTAEDTPAQVAPACSDVDSATLTYAIVTQGTKGSAGVVGGQLRYTPDADARGSDTFSYRASDGSASSSPATVTVTIGPVNHAPVCADRALNTDEDTTAAVAPACSDADGDTLTYAIVTQGTKGSAAVAEGQLFYTPDTDANGSDTFSYQASDGSASSSAATVPVTIDPVNDAPLAVDDTATTAQDTVASMNAAALVANDSDIDGDALALTEVSAPEHGEVTLQDGVVSFTPEPNYYGLAGFRYAVSDGRGGTDTANVAVTVTQAPPIISVPPPPAVSVPPPPAISVPPPPIDTGVPQTRTLIALVFTRSPGLPQAGRRFTLSLRIGTRATSTRGATRRVSCSARIGRRTLRLAAKSLGGGVGRCSWAIPRNATGKRLRSSIAIREGSQSIRKRFSATVRRDVSRVHRR